MMKSTQKYEGEGVHTPKVTKVKKLHPEAKLPTKANPTDTGFDLTCVETEWSSERPHIIQCNTGIALEHAEGTCSSVRARSSITNLPIMLANGVGTIDHSYTKELIIRFVMLEAIGKSLRSAEHIYDGLVTQLRGKRVAQLVMERYAPDDQLLEVANLNETPRGGFGSTGND